MDGTKPYEFIWFVLMYAFATIGPRSSPAAQPRRRQSQGNPARTSLPTALRDPGRRRPNTPDLPPGPPGGGDVTKPYEFKRLRATDGTTPYAFIWFRAMDMVGFWIVFYIEN